MPDMMKSLDAAALSRNGLCAGTSLWFPLKRLIDIAGALVGLFVTALLFPFIAVAIKMDSRGPVLFGQERVGWNGKVFTCWKFRTMTLDAEGRKKDLRHLNEMNGAMFKIRHDPRVTWFGRFLRKYSLDEFPQFWNTLLGEMSLVGPRPLPCKDLEGYPVWNRLRMVVRPGITGLWQVNGRNGVHDCDEVQRLDLRYIDTWSLWLDLKILFKTVFVVFSGNGAC